MSDPILPPIPIDWSQQESQDPDTFDIVTSATVNGTTRVVVRVTTEANQDKGRAKCMERAEEKIRAAFRAGKLSSPVTVMNRDFGP